MYKLLKVEWLDSARPSTDWIHISDFTPQNPVQCISVGYLLFENEKVLIAPNIFTRNRDVNENENFTIYSNVDGLVINSLQVFDRWGNLVYLSVDEELNNNNGWDGTFNGQPMPSSDYWFHVKLQDGRVFKSHFTLKR